MEKTINGFFDKIGLTKVFRKVENYTKPSTVTKEPEFSKNVNKYFEDKGVTKIVTKGLDFVGDKTTKVIVINYIFNSLL